MLQIRKAETTDLDTLREFAERTFRIAYEDGNDLETFQAYCIEAFSRERFRQEMEYPFSGFWLGFLDGQLAAYLKLNFDHTHAELLPASSVQVERIYVEPLLQGRGLGETLLQFAMEQARQAKADWLWLSVWQENPRAVQFYQRCGFEIFGTDIFQMADDPQVDWAMRKPCF